jgi:hypothetical protein
MNREISIKNNLSVFISFRIHEDHPIMSFTVSKDGRLALLNIATQVNINEVLFNRLMCFFKGCSSMGFT